MVQNKTKQKQTGNYLLSLVFSGRQFQKHEVSLSHQTWRGRVSESEFHSEPKALWSTPCYTKEEDFSRAEILLNNKLDHELNMLIVLI